jgi:hypothetical protein
MTARDRFEGRASTARRLGVTTTVAAVLTISTGIAAVAAAQPATPRAGRPNTSSAAVSAALPGAGHARRAHRARRARVQARHGGSLVLTVFDRHDCPPAATACADLTRHMTWLQAKGKVSFGPVRMEPGKPGTQHATPRGTFHVSWKAGPDFRSNIYHESMPWATFFATGGIAFHGGALTNWSHGCIHLTVANAHYYQEHLPVGAEVVVF